MFFKIIDSLRTLINETSIVRELIHGDIPQEDESQNSSELVSVLGQDRGRLIPSAPAERKAMKHRYLVVIFTDRIGNVYFDLPL